jgi:hypothetical protein
MEAERPVTPPPPQAKALKIEITEMRDLDLKRGRIDGAT